MNSDSTGHNEAGVGTDDKASDVGTEKASDGKSVATTSL